MSEHIIAGHCMHCDAPCFEVVARAEEHEPNPGEPKRLGPPLEGSTRIAFLLFDGSKADITFCAQCAQTFGPEHYTGMWRKIQRSWQRELAGSTPDWFLKSFSSGILCELGRTSWKELCKANGR